MERHSTAALATEEIDPAIPSLAVMPFANISGDPEQDYFAEGMSEELIAGLRQVPGLRVISRDIIVTFRSKHLRLQDIAEELKVRTVLEASVRRIGERVQIIAQMVDGASGGHIWAGSFEHDLAGIFELRDEMVSTVLRQMQVEHAPAGAGSVPTRSVEAYTYYLRGIDFYHRSARQYYRLAGRMFAKAIELDPAYARAHAAIATSEAMLYLDYDEKNSPESILAHAEQALALEPGLPEAHAARGLALSVTKHYAEAEAEFEKALTGDPDLFEAHYFYARAFFAQGKFLQSADHYERGAAIRPDDFQCVVLVAQVYRTLGRAGREVNAARRGVERTQRALTKDPQNPRAAYMGANALAVIGEIDRAKQWAARALAMDPDDTLTQYNIACFCCFLNEFDRAFELLERLLPHANQETKAWVRYDSDFDQLHKLPRWQTVLRLSE